MLAVLVLAEPWSGAASDKTVLIELDLKSGAQPLGVSAGGAVVVGGLGTGGGFYWMPTTGVIFAGGLFASKVSRDGKVIVGQAIDAGLRQAAIWQRGAEWRALGTFPNGQPCDSFLSLANDTSGDGKIVVGYARNGCQLLHAFRWEASTGMVDLGSSVAGRTSQAFGISADGQVAVGYQEQEGGFVEGTKWIGTRQERVPGSDGYVGAANATNVDGSIVVGRICRPLAGGPSDPGYQNAWVWTRDGTQCLPPPKLRVATGGPLIIVEGNGTSDDGRVIGGGQAVASSPDSEAGDAALRPFVFGGLGATFFSATDLQSETKRSFDYGAGLNYFAWRRIGMRAHVRFKPTALHDTSAGNVCDPFGFCQSWLTQIEFAAGAVVRF